MTPHGRSARADVLVSGPAGLAHCLSAVYLFIPATIRKSVVERIRVRWTVFGLSSARARR